MKKRFAIVGLSIACIIATSHVVSATTATTDKNYETLSVELERNIEKDDTSRSTDARMKALDIGQDTVKYISSEDLVRLCLENPFSSLIVTANDPIAWLDEFAETFAPFRELLSRDDVADAVLSVRVGGTARGEKFKVYDKDFLDAVLIKTNNQDKLPEDVDAWYSGEGQRLSVYTPKGTAVTVQKRGEKLTAAGKREIDNRMATLFPNATRLASATTHYNCHSYAWYSNSTNNKYWMENPSAYMSDTSYISVSSSFSGKTRVYYKGEHTALRNAGETKVVSKWGKADLYKHTITHCPYSKPRTFWKFNPNMRTT